MVWREEDKSLHSLSLLHCAHIGSHPTCLQPCLLGLLNGR